MSDPYQTLGVDANASDSEIKRAYRELARKYHPDNYQDNPLADLAEEKMKEINEAYEAITKMRSGGGSYSGSYSSSSRSSGGGAGYQTQGADRAFYGQVRQLINQGGLDEAEQLLMQSGVRNGEYYFLMGSIAARRGWLDEARQNYQMAYQMDPTNMEYRKAVSSMNQGGFAYQNGNMNMQTCDTCDICTGLMCMNCLCGGCH